MPSPTASAWHSSWAPAPKHAFLVLLAVRSISALLNIIPDCDEVYNYLEPLHYLLHGAGLQTWEYSARFALRPYLYLLLHAVVAWPATALFGAGRGARLQMLGCFGAFGARGDGISLAAFLPTCAPLRPITPSLMQERWPPSIFSSWHWEPYQRAPRRCCTRQCAGAVRP